VTDCLPSKHEALSSTPSLPKNKKKIKLHKGLELWLSNSTLA
jgi:hypothetical protein